jgi:hypothetical protein
VRQRIGRAAARHARVDVSGHSPHLLKSAGESTSCSRKSGVG